MPIPKELQNRDKTITVGTTTIRIDHGKGMVVIDHRGNMGSDINSVKENVDLILGKGWFEKLEESCVHIIDAGAPDYCYTRTMWF